MIEVARIEGALVRDGYERVKADLEALPADQLVQVNADVQTVTRAILGALPEMQALRARLVAELPRFDVAAFDKLDDYVQAMKFAQSGFLIATQPPDDLKALTEEGGKLHDRLLADAKALAAYGLFDGNVLATLKGGNGFNNLAEDLELLSHAMIDGWAKLQTKALTPFEDVESASRIGYRLTQIAGLREQGPARLALASELRMRAFTLLVRTYDDARSAIGYLRRKEDDVDSIAPNLYPGRPSRRKAAADATQVPAGSVAPVATGTHAPVVPAPTVAVGNGAPGVTNGAGSDNPFGA